MEYPTTSVSPCQSARIRSTDWAGTTGSTAVAGQLLLNLACRSSASALHLRDANWYPREMWPLQGLHLGIETVEVLKSRSNVKEQRAERANALIAAEIAKLRARIMEHTKKLRLSKELAALEKDTEHSWQALLMKGIHRTLVQLVVSCLP